jgi:hypothetical protein
VKRVDQIRVTLSLKGINDLHDKPSFYRLDDSIKELSEDIVHNKLDLYRSDRDAEESSEDIEAKDHREVRSRFFSNTALAPSDSSLGTHFATIARRRRTNILRRENLSILLKTLQSSIFSPYTHITKTY